MHQIINTDRELHALKPEATRYERAVTKARGLSVLVYPNGCKTFVVRYVANNGVRRRLPLGDYPGLGLADARLKAQAVKLEVVEGADPAGERIAARVQARTGETFAELAESYWTAAAIGIHGGRRRPLRSSTLDRQKGLWAKHLKPVFGHLRYKDIRRPDIRRYMHGLVLEGNLSASSIASIGDVLRALFTHALNEDLVEFNPTLGLTRPITPESRARLFTEEALRLILASLREASAACEDGRDDPHARMGPHMALGLRFLILTLTRRTEVAAARWAEIDLKAKTWLIPGARTKNRQPHVVPLSSQALEILEAAQQLSNASPDGFVFPSPTVIGAHLDEHAMTRAVNRLCARLKLPLGSPHDFRRTGATTLTGERFGIRRFIVGKVLAHTAQDGPAVTSIYDRNDYLPEKREALAAWGLYVDELVGPDGGRPKVRSRTHLRLVSAA